jgi:hypothetical protein
MSGHGGHHDERRPCIRGGSAAARLPRAIRAAPATA